MEAVNRLIRRRPRIVAVVALLFALGAAMAAVFVGFKIGDQKLPTYGLWKKVDIKIAALIPGSRSSGIPPKLQGSTIQTGLVKLITDVKPVEIEQPERSSNLMAYSGGGLTAIGDDILLLAYDGRIYVDRAGEDAHVTKVRAPETHREVFGALEKDPAYAEYGFDAYYIRYNDLLYFDDGAKRGLLASYTEYNPEQVCYNNAVARLDFAAGVQSIDAVTAGARDWTIIYRSKPCLQLKKRFSAIEGHMGGGRMALLNPNTIVLTMGDFHVDGMRSEGPGIAQDPAAEYGKVMRVDIATGASKILSLGHRNQQGITVDDKGDIYVAEHGPQGGDELNRIVEGKNYGWPKESLGISYSNEKMPEATTLGRHDMFEPPVFAWMPSPAVSSLIQIKGGFHDAWTGDLLVGTLSNAIIRVRFANGKPIYSERIEVGTRVRDIQQLASGQIVLWSDNRELVWLKAEDRDSSADTLKQYLASNKVDKAVAHKFETAVSRCAECHSFAVGDSARSPSLARIYDDPIASTGFASYSPALSGKSGKWTSENLTKFLSNPQDFAPGTVMPAVVDNDPKVVAALVDYLRHYDQRF